MNINKISHIYRTAFIYKSNYFCPESYISQIKQLEIHAEDTVFRLWAIGWRIILYFQARRTLST